MKDAFRAELVKILTVRGLRTGVLLSLVAIPLTSLLVASTGGLSDADTITSGAATGTVVGLLAYGAWAASFAGSEYVHDTITVSLSTVPRRAVLFGAKLAAVATVTGAGALASALISYVLVRVSTPSGAHHDGDIAALLGVVLAVVAVAVVGAAVGLLVRASTGAIAIVAAAVLLPKAAAGLLGGLQKTVVGASPGSVVTQLVSSGQLSPDETFPGGTALAVLTMVAVAAVVAIGVGVAFTRRDG